MEMDFVGSNLNIEFNEEYYNLLFSISVYDKISDLHSIQLN